MSKEILLGFLEDAKRDYRNTCAVIAIINQLIAIIEEHYNKSQQVIMQCPPAVELANKIESTDYKNQLEQVQRNCDVIASLHSKLSVDYEETRKKNENLLEMLAEQKEEVDKKERILQQLQKDKQILNVENDRIGHDYFNLQIKFNKINEEYVQLQRSHNHLKETRKGQDVQYNLLQQGYNEVAEERDRLQEQHNQMKQQLDKAANDWNKVNDDLVAHNLKLHAENIELAQQHDNTLKENYKLRAAVRAPESFKVVENATLEGMKTRHNNLEQEKIKFLEDISQLVADKEILQETLNRMTEKYDTLRKECLGLQQTINNLLGISPIKNPKDSITITTHDGRQKEIY